MTVTAINRNAAAAARLAEAVAEYTEDYIGSLDETNIECSDLYHEVERMMQKSLLSTTMQLHHNNQTASAAALGIHRATTRTYLKNNSLL